MMIQRIPENLLRIVKDARISLRSSTSGTQIAQNLRIRHPGREEVGQERIPGREAGKVHRQINPRGARCASTNSQIGSYCLIID